MIEDLLLPDEADVRTAHPAGTVGGGDGSILNVLGLDSDFRAWKKLPGRTLVIVNDGTRPTPTARILNTDRAFFSSGEVRYIVATGAHRSPAENEWDHIFGKLYNNVKRQIHIHDARDAGSMRYYGTTTRGTEVYYNSLLEQAEKILIIGSVEPHYFAGFTGGRKGLLPGIAGYETITANHKLALQPGAGLMNLSGNPVHEDMIEAAGMVENKSIYTVMAVLDCEQNIYSLHSGALDAAFNEAAEASRAVFTVELDRPADIIITRAGFPMNKDLYQSQKAVENVRGALARGGTVILLAECREGIGDSTFYDLLAEGSSPGDALEQINRGYKLGYHKAAKLAELASEAYIFAVTEIKDKLLENIFISPFKTVQAAYNAARERHIERTGCEPAVLIVPDGSVTVPVEKKRPAVL